ncbi:response regulator [Candidatus Trichorickettsia mobilis]|uniref:response regulator n=1 Tax=Candidatus Trichorickettsia mobilis TaxID=1346319 RepID=UPI00292F9E6F|nr:response regulator [Candidatus Trichorickettsia mobilis]
MTKPLRLVSSKQKTYNILFVDDDQACHDVISLILHDPCYKVIHAYSAVEALELVEQFYQKLGLILLDVTLRDISGYEVYRVIRSNPASHNIPIVLQTGLTISVSDLKQIIGVNEIDVIYKPYTAKALLEVIHKLCILTESK